MTLSSGSPALQPPQAAQQPSPGQDALRDAACQRLYDLAGDVADQLRR
jgi:hypothetical protein